MKNKTNNYTVAKNAKELSEALGLESEADTALVEYKAQLSQMAVKAILKSGLTINEVVKRSGVARSKVSASDSSPKASESSFAFLATV